MSKASGMFERVGLSWPASLEALAEESLPDFLIHQRWYPAKDAGKPTVALEAAVPVPAFGVEAALAVWRVLMPPDQAPFHLFVPVALLPTSGADETQVITRLEDPAVCLV